MFTIPQEFEEFFLFSTGIETTGVQAREELDGRGRSGKKLRRRRCSTEGGGYVRQDGMGRNTVRKKDPLRGMCPPVRRPQRDASGERGPHTNTDTGGEYSRDPTTTAFS